MRLQISILQSSIKTHHQRGTAGDKPISILQSSIKTFMISLMPAITLFISILQSSIKTRYRNAKNGFMPLFQFYKVRLKQNGTVGTLSLILFQFYKVRLKHSWNGYSSAGHIYFNSTKFD